MVVADADEPVEMSGPSAIERLVRLDNPLAPLLADDGQGQPTWFEHDGWRVYSSPVDAQDGTHDPLVWFSRPNGHAVALRHDAASRRTMPPFDLDAAYVAYVFETWIEKAAVRRLTHRQLDTFYRLKPLIPRSAQLSARRWLIRWQGMPPFPAWPVDLSVARLARFYAFCVLLAQGRSEASFDWFWPQTYRAALVLTHDVETLEGLRRAVDLADDEEERGFRSSFNLGGWYDVDPGIIRELTDRGFEVGVHGLRHDRSLFSSREEFDAQRGPLSELVSRFGARGFRSPATHRVVEWIGELPVDYDCSIPHSDPFEPQPGGCCSLWPFFIDGVVELPYTLPQDHLLFTLLRHKTPRLWIEESKRIEQEFGLIQCVSHPDPGYLAGSKRRKLYAEFLSELAERRHVWKALPRDVAAWWRKRDTGATSSSRGSIRIGGSPDEVELQPLRVDSALAREGSP
jgi:peptidoglycan/xylan/chitin deacetylase (PgdA/CDA1 family)